MKYRSDLDDRESRLLSMESRLKDEKEEQKKQLDLLDQEVSVRCTGQPHYNAGLMWHGGGGGGGNTRTSSLTRLLLCDARCWGREEKG